MPIQQSPAEHEFVRSATERFVQGDGLTLRYLEWGRPDAPAVVLLHGGGLTAHSWDVVCDIMSGAHHCVALDLRGHGDSQWSEAAAYTLEDHAEDVAAAARALSLERFVLVGQSLGGLTALTFAGRHPGAVQALVLVDTGPRGSRAAGRERIRGFMEGPAELQEVEDFVERAVAFNPRRPRERLRRSLLHNLRQTQKGTWTWKYDPRITDPFRNGDPAPRRQRLVEAASRVDCPVLIVRGGDSEHMHAEDADAAVTQFRDARWVSIPGAGHTVQGDRPRELVVALNRFLSESSLA